MRTGSFLTSILLATWLAGCGGSAPEEPAPAPTAGPTGQVDEARTEPDPPAGPLRDIQIKVVPVLDPGLEKVREYTRMFYGGELEQLFEKFSPEMRDEILPLDKLRGLREFVLRKYGDEVDVVGEDAETRGEYRGFVRWARFSKDEALVELQWILRPDDTIAGFIVRPAQQPQGR